MARQQLRRTAPEGGLLVSVERIIRDERQVPNRIDADNQLIRVPRWEIWLGRWVPASGFLSFSSSYASLAQAPSALMVVARPMPEECCGQGERPADPWTIDEGR